MAQCFSESKNLHRARLTLAAYVLQCYNTCCDAHHAPIVYRLGHMVFIHKSGVRFSVGAPAKPIRPGCTSFLQNLHSSFLFSTVLGFTTGCVLPKVDTVL